MRIISLYITILQIGRALEIVAIVTKLGLAEMCDSIRIYFCRKSGSKRGTCKRSHTQKNITTAQRVRNTIEKLGPTYVKFGQILADRPDLISNSFRQELKKLQSFAKPFDNTLAFSMVEKSLGAPIDSIFSTFTEEPIAAASIGQVYGATLFSGEKVVVKIQRPFIENKIKLDIFLMKFLASRLSKSYPELTAINLTGLIEEFRDSLSRELDYQNEAANLKLFVELFKDDNTIKIPMVYDQYTTSKLLVMERIEGVTPDTAQRLQEAGLSPEKVVEIGAKSVVKMIMKFGIFHADPHPGNLFVSKGNVVGLIDFGMVGVLRTREIDFIADFIVGFALRDENMLSRALLTLCGSKYFEYAGELRFDVKKLIMVYRTTKRVDMQHFSTVIQRCIDLMIKYRLQIPSGIFLLVKAFATLEKFAFNLDPSADLAPIVLPYAKEIVKERYSLEKIYGTLYDSAIEYIKLFTELPADIGEIIYKVKQGEIKHNLILKDKTTFVMAMRNFSLRLSYVVLLVGVFIGSALLIVWNSEHTYGITTLYISSTLMVLLLCGWIFRKK